MDAYNSDIRQSLKWLQSNAPNITALIEQKNNWYLTNQDQFWTNWEENIFNLETANTFGIMVWCVILGVPSSLFGLYPGNATSWAYGANRQNFKYVDSGHAIPNHNLIGGNFFGGGDTTILNLREARWALRLRYVSLVSNGKIAFINRMLRWIFNNDQPWDFPGKVYFYVTDSTAPAQTLTPSAPVASPFHLEYRIGANFKVSEQFINTLNAAQYGIMPTCAGSSYVVIQET